MGHALHSTYSILDSILTGFWSWDVNCNCFLSQIIHWLIISLIYVTLYIAIYCHILLVICMLAQLIALIASWVPVRKTINMVCLILPDYHILRVNYFLQKGFWKSLLSSIFFNISVNTWITPILLSIVHYPLLHLIIYWRLTLFLNNVSSTSTSNTKSIRKSAFNVFSQI